MFHIPYCEHSLALWKKKYNFAYVELTLINKGTSGMLVPFISRICRNFSKQTLYLLAYYNRYIYSSRFFFIH